MTWFWKKWTSIYPMYVPFASFSVHWNVERKNDSMIWRLAESTIVHRVVLLTTITMSMSLLLCVPI